MIEMDPLSFLCHRSILFLDELSQEKDIEEFLLCKALVNTWPEKLI